MAVMEKVAPQTWEDLTWARSSRTDPMGSGHRTLDHRAREEPAYVPPPVDLPAWRTVTDLPTMAATCPCEGPWPLLVHAADYPHNGISLFTGLTAATRPHVGLCLYGPGGPIRSALAATVQPPGLSAGLRGYGAVELFVLGNSADHLGVLKELLDGAPRRRREGVTTAIYLHDVSLKYLLEMYFGSQVDDYLRCEYGSGIDRTVDSTLRLLTGSSGVRLLVRLSGARAVICHGLEVGRLLGEELDVLEPPCTVHHLDHPLFAATHQAGERTGCCPERDDVLELIARAQRGDRFAGSFGIPYDWKRPEDVAHVCESLVRAGELEGYIFAGWEAHKVLPEALLAQEGVSVFSATCTPCLVDLMAHVSVAVQLRAVLGGEASGVVAQLTLLGTPAVVSRTLEPFVSSTVTGLSVHADPDEIRNAIVVTLNQTHRTHALPTEESVIEPTDVESYWRDLCGVLGLTEVDCA